MSDFINLRVTLGDPWHSLLAAFLGFCVLSFAFNAFTRGAVVSYVRRHPDEYPGGNFSLHINTAILLIVLTIGSFLFARAVGDSLVLAFSVAPLILAAFLIGIILEGRSDTSTESDERTTPPVKPKRFWNRDDVTGVLSIILSVAFGTLAGWISHVPAIAFLVGSLGWAGLLFALDRVDSRRRNLQRQQT